MKKIKTTVTYKVSDGFYCNLRQKAWKNFPPEQRCRFCTQVTKNNFVCVLHNIPLVVEEGSLIKKAEQCLKNIAYRSQTVPEPAEKPIIKPKELIKWALNEYTKTYNQLIRDGYPEALAIKFAKEAVGGVYNDKDL